jgi:hypothetical protein
MPGFSAPGSYLHSIGYSRSSPPVRTQAEGLGKAGAVYPARSSRLAVQERPLTVAL